jgi:hypothetical protein
VTKTAVSPVVVTIQKFVSTTLTATVDSVAQILPGRSLFLTLTAVQDSAASVFALIQRAQRGTRKRIAPGHFSSTSAGSIDSGAGGDIEDDTPGGHITRSQPGWIDRSRGGD